MTSPIPAPFPPQSVHWNRLWQPRKSGGDCTVITLSPSPTPHPLTHPLPRHILPVLLVLPLKHIESVSSSLCTANSLIQVPSTYCWDYCKNKPAGFLRQFTSPLCKLLQRLLLLRRKLQLLTRSQGPTACSCLSPHLTPPSPLPTVYLAHFTSAITSSWKLTRLRHGRLTGILGFHPQGPLPRPSLATLSQAHLSSCSAYFPS